MKRYIPALLVLALAMASTATAGTRTYFGFQIGIGNAPPPPAAVFQAPPPMYCDPDTRVYVMQNPYDDGDVFRYGPYWYMCSGDFWYRSRSYRGPFAVIDVRSVPGPIFRVPQPRWHHYPQRLARWNEGRGHGWGRGHGRGQAHRAERGRPDRD